MNCIKSIIIFSSSTIRYIIKNYNSRFFATPVESSLFVSWLTSTLRGGRGVARAWLLGETLAHQAVVVAVVRHQMALLRKNRNHGGLGPQIHLRQAASVLNDVC